MTTFDPIPMPRTCSRSIHRSTRALAALFALSCSPPPAPASPSSAGAAVGQKVIGPLTLAPCEIPDLPRAARCGIARLLEDPATPTGRVIALKVVVVPAKQSPALPDPLVFISGGPGQAATDGIADVLGELERTSASRDFVFVDQRGMGHDSPLRCKLIADGDVGGLPAGELSEAKLQSCLASMDANPAFYTTSMAAEDLNAVLGALGYAQANVVGVSYGTFATQTLAHAHPERVRTMILHGVVPPDERFVLGFAPSSEMALEQTFAECAANSVCHAMHPDPKGELARAFARLDAHPEQLTARGPADRPYTVTLNRKSFAMALRNPLYVATGRGRALSMIHDVAEGRYDEMGPHLLDTAFMLGEGLSVGGYLSVACAESMSGVTMAQVEEASAGSFLGTARAAPIWNACRFWPTGKVPAWLHEPVASEIPSLLFGGTIDPATPLAGMEKAKAKLPNAQAVIVPGAGHEVGGACTDAIVSAFVDHPLVRVDTHCVKPIVTRFLPPTIKLPKETLDRYLGSFAVHPDFVLTVSREGDELFVQATGKDKLRLDAESELAFRVRELDALFVFEMGPDGRARRLKFVQGESVEPGDRVPSPTAATPAAKSSQ